MKLRSLFYISVLLVISVATNCFALEIPKSAGGDERIKKVVYNKNEVVRVNAFVGIGTQIVFAEDEEVKDYGSGFSEGWIFEKRGNSLYLKPRMEGSDTNLFVVTNKRPYSFELVLHKDWKKRKGQNIPYDARMAFRIEFQYPDDDADMSKMLADRKEIRERLNKKNLARNWNYTMHINKNSREIAPTMAYDDGRFTYLKFPNNREVPAIFLVFDDKSESLVNSHVIEDTIVVQRVAKEFVLRLGDAVVGLYNESYDPDGIPPKNGMAVEGLQRVIKGAE